MTSFTSKASGIEPRVVCDIADMIAHNDNAIVSRTLMNKTSGSVTLFAFDEGQRLSEHTSPFDALVHVLEGTAQVTIGGEAKDVAAGQVVLMPANVPHAVSAPQSFKMLLIMLKGDAE
ncbi:MAG: cupin domain-containing protein [Phycisphaerales bacterium]|nr:cupin domain-containing protein [Phycisphaerales bacterium]MCB9856360.1 cupin domain-containing protein [Phycisphaerales bacterium]MCB9864032.1 cupin domain-containing protein [Phycisphaerales bacterium]